jgi:hypothetical protein
MFPLASMPRMLSSHTRLTEPERAAQSSIVSPR